MKTLLNKTGAMAMRKNMRPLTFLVVVVAILSLAAVALESRADDDEDDGENEVPFEEANIFLELNHTDGDLGIHALVDGDAWKKLEIEGPDDREILVVKGRGQLGQHGLTEVFFESDEPGFDELPPNEFLVRFPAGAYKFEGKTVEGDELGSTEELRHILPAPPANILISGIPAAENCDAASLPSVDGNEPVIIKWDAVTQSHPQIGTPTSSPDIDIVGYQVVVEREEPTLLVFSVDLPPSDEPQVTVPPELIALGAEFKLEVLVREASGNRTAVETCFETEE
jgi:hypothetical protein